MNLSPPVVMKVSSCKSFRVTECVKHQVKQEKFFEKTNILVRWFAEIVIYARKIYTLAKGKWDNKNQKLEKFKELPVNTVPEITRN